MVSACGSCGTSFVAFLEGTSKQMKTAPLESIEQALDRYYRDYLRSMDLELAS
jgi:hypothetical protein